MKIGLQLYTLRDHLNTRIDFLETIDEVASIGFQGVEIAGVGCLGKEVSLEEARLWIKATGMAVIGAHRDWVRLVKETDEEIAFLKELEATYVAVPNPPEGFEEGGISTYRQWLAEAKAVSDKLAVKGITLGYHNHAADFERHWPGGLRPYDVLIEEAPWLALEMDTYWVHHSGCDVLSLIKRLSGRLPCVHVKDVAPYGFKVSFAPVGEGNLNWSEILPAFRDAGTEWLIVEQDTCRRDPFESIESSLKFLKGFLSSESVPVVVEPVVSSQSHWAGS